jgi:Fe-S-cluster containining protein
MSPAEIAKEKKGLTVLGPNDVFHFTCSPELPCFTRCCRDITIFLTPYDILRMRRALGLSSSDFLARHTVTMIGDTGLPVVVLKMSDDDDRRCPFVTDAGCRIYADRPWPCRIYPLQPESSKITEKAGKAYYSVLDIPFCQGLKSDHPWKLSDWIESQGIEAYVQMETLLKRITNHEKLTSDKITNRKIQDMYYMACYDLDRFRRFVLESSFLQRFEVSPEEVEAISNDDEALYRFALRWLEYGLLAQQVLKVKPDVMAAKKQELGIQ